MKKNATLEVILNPLLLAEAISPNFGSISSEVILKFICSPEIVAEPSVLVDRYNEISTDGNKLFAAPNEQRILDKLIWPLKHAQNAYMLGNYIGTIATCGMVSEMVAMLYFNTADLRLSNLDLLEDDQEIISKSEFEKDGQKKRVRTLVKYKLINDSVKDNFDTIRNKRKLYLHLWSHDHEKLPTDAKCVFQAAVQLVVEVIGQDVIDGKIVLKPAMVEYLKQSGIYKLEDEETSDD